MPTYDYQCKACSEETEIFHSMSEAPKRKCPECGKMALKRKIGTGGAIIFKGSGFYQTDYRSESYKKGAAAEKNGAASDGKSKGDSGKSESKGSAESISDSDSIMYPTKRSSPSS